METKLASSRILISLVWGGDANGRAQVTTSRSLSLFFFFLVDSQQSLLRQQERVEERVQEIEEQLCKLDSDKCVVEVRSHTQL